MNGATEEQLVCVEYPAKYKVVPIERVQKITKVKIS